MRLSAIRKVVNVIEAERAELLARVAVLDQMIAKLLVSSQVTKPTARKPKSGKPTIAELERLVTSTDEMIRNR